MKKLRLFSLFLTVCIILPASSFATSVEAITPIETEVYWIDNINNFISLFGLGAGLEQQSVESNMHSATHSLYVDSSQTDNRSCKKIEKQELNALYTFDIDGSGANSPITVEGKLKTYEHADSFSIQMGILTGTAMIRDVSCAIRAVVQKEVNSDKLNAGITIVPANAHSLEDYIFFSIGEGIITVDMLPEWIVLGKTSSLENVEAEENLSLKATSGSYELLSAAGNAFESGFEVPGLAQWTEFYHNPDINRLCVGTTSFTEDVDDYFSSGGISSTIVSLLEIGVKSEASDIPYIDNVHEIPESASTGEDFIDPDYISYLTELLSDVFDVAGSYFAPFEIMMEALSENNTVDVSVNASGSDSSVLFEYTTNLFYLEDVSFDDTPMPVTFNLDTSRSAYGTFSAYSSIEYFTIYIPENSEYPAYLSISGGELETENHELWVTH